MNTSDILKYGHLAVVTTLEHVLQSHWSDPDVCGWWSTRDIIAHLASYEHVLVDVCHSLLGASFLSGC